MDPSPAKVVIATACLGALGAIAEAQLGPDKNILHDQATAFSSVSTLESDDRLGSALAAGDFNGDGWDDLAVGSPHEDIGKFVNAGAVFVIFGGEDGLQQRAGSLTGNAAEAFNQNDLAAAGDPIGEGAESQDRFGEVLAAGDFDGDGFDDLAVGVPSESLAPVDAAPEGATHQNIGIVVVVYGSSQGLRGLGGELRFVVLDADRLRDLVPMDERFGAALAVGDFNGNGVDDLAVGEPGADNGGSTGAVSVYRGSLGEELSDAARTAVYETIDAGFGGPEIGDQFGAAVAAGDFDADGYDDLAIGAPGETTGADQLGAVHIARGAANGIGSPLDGLAIPGGETATRWTMAAGHYGVVDEYEDLAVGIPEHSHLELLEGGPKGFPSFLRIVASAEYGASLAWGEIGAFGPGLAIGRPGDGEQEVHLFPGDVFSQDVQGMLDSIETGDRFGAAVAIGEFGLGEGSDLAVGVPFEDTSGFTNNGAFHVIYNRLLFVDGFESTDTGEWSDSQP